MVSVSNSIVLLWFVPVILQIGVPLVILTVRMTHMCYKKIARPKRDRSIDIDFRLLGSAAS